MLDTSIDMLLQESILDDSATASLMEGRDSFVYQDALCQSRRGGGEVGQEILAPNHDKDSRTHNHLPSTNANEQQQSPPSDFLEQQRKRATNFRTSPRLLFGMPCQEEYDAFKPKLCQLISTFVSGHGRIPIREYKSMSGVDQHLERERVVSLLYRLGIVSRCPESQGSKNPSFFCQHVMEYCNGSDQGDNNRQRRNLRGTSRNSNTEHLSQPFSAEKLSPIRGGSEKSQDFPVMGGSFLDESIETARQADDSPLPRLSLYESPPLPPVKGGSTTSQPNIQKRLASTSGKRGKDTFRIKYLPDSSTTHGSPTPASHHPWSPEDSVSFLMAAKEIQPLPFSASQSLIESSPRRPNQKTCSSDDSASTSLSLDETQHSCSYRDLRPSSITSGRWMQVSNNLALKEGVPLHYNPLQIQVTKGKGREEIYKGEPSMRPSLEFRDPLKAFVGEGGQALQHVFEWIYARDRKTSTTRCDKWSSDSKGIIFSLAPAQIVSVIMKLLLDVDGHSRYELRSNEDCESILTGQTLIVVRSKEDIAVWERALREHTPFSVASHADLSSSERKHAATAAKCATFDVVLTTYDALKSPDSTIQVDEDGHAMFRQGAKSHASSGWMVKRAQGNCQGMQSQGIGSAVLCKKLSGLHTVWWRRIVFVDELGKKCFVAKQGTSRAYAAAALGGAARFLFFHRHTSSNGMRTAFEALLRSDKRSIQCVASTLQIEVDHIDEDLLGVMLDLEDEFSN